MPELDRLIDAALSEVNPGKRMELIASATKMATDSYTAFMFCQVPVLGVIGPRVDVSGWPQPISLDSFGVYAAYTKHAK